KLAREGCGVHQITEQDGKLTAFGVGERRSGWWKQAPGGLDLRGGRLWPALGGRGNAEGGHIRTTRPDQHFPIVVHREPLALDDFNLQVFQGFIIELELPLERAVRHSTTSLEHGHRLVENLLKGHRQPSLYR